MAEGVLLLLGTGSSAGIPVMGCDCSVCTSQDPKNKRLRASALVRYAGTNLLIDAGPDIRQQCLKFGIRHVDGLILTHTHFDHVGGLEELRVFNFKQQKPIPCLLSQESLNEVKMLFHYFFEEHDKDKTIPAKFTFHTLLEDRAKLTFCDIPLRCFSYAQSKMKVTGVRLGDLAYVTDIKEYPKTIFADLANLNTLVISALRFTSSRLQFSIDEAIDFAERVKAKTTYLIHMAHEIEHEHLQSLLPSNILPAYDGLEIAFDLRYA